MDLYFSQFMIPYRQVFCLCYVYAALGGVNIKALLDDAALEVGGKILVDFNDSMGDRIQVFLE